jgi:hypothetical protein
VTPASLPAAHCRPPRPQFGDSQPPPDYCYCPVDFDCPYAYRSNAHRRVNGICGAQIGRVIVALRIVAAVIKAIAMAAVVAIVVMPTTVVVLIVMLVVVLIVMLAIVAVVVIMPCMITAVIATGQGCRSRCKEQECQSVSCQFFHGTSPVG